MKPCSDKQVPPFVHVGVQITGPAAVVGVVSGVVVAEHSGTARVQIRYLLLMISQQLCSFRIKLTNRPKKRVA